MAMGNKVSDEIDMEGQEEEGILNLSWALGTSHRCSDTVLGSL